MFDKRISVILPAYNAESFLDEAIESILSQTFREFELLLFDDGSSDRTPDICKRFAEADKRVEVITQANRGLLSVLQHGIEIAQAPLIARMDADDVAEANRLEKQVEFLSQHPGCVAVGSRVLRIDPDGDPIDLAPVSKHHDDIERELLENEPGKICHPTVLMRTNAVREVGGYQQDYHFEDVDLFLRLAEVGKLANLEEPLLRYRLHGNSICHTRDQIRIDKLYADVVGRARARRGVGAELTQERLEAGTQSSLASVYSAIDSESADVSPNHGSEDKLDGYYETACHWTSLAVDGGHVKTAYKHAFRALRCRPFATKSWWALGCCVLGRSRCDRWVMRFTSLRRLFRLGTRVAPESVNQSEREVR